MLIHGIFQPAPTLSTFHNPSPLEPKIAPCLSLRNFSATFLLLILLELLFRSSNRLYVFFSYDKCTEVQMRIQILFYRAKFSFPLRTIF